MGVPKIVVPNFIIQSSWMTMTEYWNNLQVTTGDPWLKKPTSHGNHNGNHVATRLVNYYNLPIYIFIYMHTCLIHIYIYMFNTCFSRQSSGFTWIPNAPLFRDRSWAGCFALQTSVIPRSLGASTRRRKRDFLWENQGFLWDFMGFYRI